MDQPDLHVLRTEADRHEFEEWLQYGPFLAHFAVDTETTGLNVWHDRLRVVQFGDVHTGWAIPVEGREIGKQAVRWAFWYMKERAELIAHRMKFDIQFLRNAGYDTSTVKHDSKASCHLMNPAVSGLKEAAAERFGEWAIKGEQLLKEHMRKHKYTYETVPVDDYEYAMYAALDPVLAARVQAHNEPTIAAHYQDLYDMECEVALALVEAERRGMNVDIPYCEEQLEILEEEIIDLEEKWKDDVNLGSTKQLAKIFRDAGHKLPRTAPSKTFPEGQDQVTEEVLEHLIVEGLQKGLPNILATDALRYRQLEKNAGTYFGSYIDLAIDGKIHTFIETLGARNGRMSSRQPNLQNIPRRRAGAYVRRAFYASEDHTLVSVDMDQIEYRIFASAAREPRMIDAINAGEDLHAMVAQIVYDDASINTEDPRRDIAKNANFAEIYMAGADKFAKTAGISLTEGKAFKTKYHQRFPSVKPFTREVMKYAQANGLAVDSKFGRRIPVDADKVYAAVNYLISSTAADVLKRGIRALNATDWIDYYLLSVHDENIFEVPDELVPQALVEIPELMSDREAFDVPLTASAKSGKRWGEWS